MGIFYFEKIFFARSLASIVHSISRRSLRKMFHFCARIERTSLSSYSRRWEKSSTVMIAYFTFFQKNVFSRKLLNSILSRSPMINMSTILLVFSLRKLRTASEIVTRSRDFLHLKNSLTGFMTSYVFMNISMSSG